jgi:hypothetical protein
LFEHRFVDHSDSCKVFSALQDISDHGISVYQAYGISVYHDHGNSVYHYPGNSAYHFQGMMGLARGGYWGRARRLHFTVPKGEGQSIAGPTSDSSARADRIMKILVSNCELKGVNTRIYWNKLFAGPS